MNEAQAKKIFEKYNPANDVARCPNGRASVRKELDLYAKAAVNLYGIIPMKELVEIFNSQNVEQTSSDEVYNLLLPLVLKVKSPWYCFYKNSIVHYWAIENFDIADYWLRQQADKPRYVPDKNELLMFEKQYYEDAKQRRCWDNIYDYFSGTWPVSRHIYSCYREVKEYIIDADGISKLSEIFDKYDLVFPDESSMQRFLDLLMEAKNSTRLMENKGHTPAEMAKLLEAKRPKKTEPQLQKPRKVGMNDPCPCGSGKKYKRCCRLTEESKSAQLSRSECQLFYETWYGLMGFINEKLKILNARILPIYPNSISDEQVFRVREKLWENPNLIDKYIAAAKLPPEKTALLKSWRERHLKGMFVLLEYKPEYAVLLASGKDGDDRLYGVKGMTNSLAGVMKRQLPTTIETVLLPFNDKIIYDGFIGSMPIGYGEGAMKSIQEWHEKALAYGIITSME
jgi:hypothetical protein